VNTFFWNFELPTLDDLDGLCWLVSRLLWNLLDFLDDLVAFKDLAEDNVLAVKMAVRRLVIG
jgi:hypothetical protein